MKIKNMANRLATALAGFILIAPSLVFVPIASATGTDTQGAPTQANCNSGMGSQSWNQLDHGNAVDRPVISSVFVDDQEISNYVAPSAGGLGVSICANVAMGRRSGLFLYQRLTPPEGQDDMVINDFDLGGAVIDPDNDAETDNNITIDADSEITININDFGDLGKYFSFALVHGYVTNYETTNLGETNATLSVTLKPVRTPFGSGDDFEFCSATPPNCNANKSDVDALSASLDMTFTTSGTEGGEDEVYDEEGRYSEMRGAYIGMTGAMGGWAEVAYNGDSQYLKASLGGPHFLADGTTLNVGSLQAYIPNEVLITLFGLGSADIDANVIDVIRTEGDDSELAPFDVLPLDDGIIVSMSDVTFSSPTYNIGLAGFSVGGGGGDEDTDNSKSMELSDGTQVNLQTADGTTITSFTNSKESALAAADSTFDYPFGLFNFTVEVPQSSTQTINLLIMTDLKPNQVTARKYNSTTKTYSTITGATIGEDEFDGHNVLTVSYDITDGGTLDQDGSANGVIVDPVGLGTSVVAAPNTGFGGSF